MVKDLILTSLQMVVKGLGYSKTNTNKTSPDIVCTISKNPQFGDYSSNIALQLSKLKTSNSKQTPQEIANQLVTRFRSQESSKEYLEKVEVAGGGFINFFIKRAALANDLKGILDNGQEYGKSEIGKGKKIRVEFVSANPTGPLHIGNARGGPLGDVIANIFSFLGYEVLREYIDNNAGEQIRALGATIKAKYHGNLVEGNQYQGEYINELVKGLEEQINGKNDEELGKLAVEQLYEEIMADCHQMGIKFDLIIHESELREKAPQVIDELKKSGVVKEKDGALWLAPSDEFLKDRETVIQKSNGDYTYFTSDIVYHQMKFASGAEAIIDVFGSNHHGHVPRLQAAMQALEFDPNKLRVVLYQYVRVKRGDELVKMSKRAGDFITAREVLDEVGVDAFRFYLLRFAPQTHMDFDIELLKEHSNKNPVYYVQYAYARMNNILVKSEKFKAMPAGRQVQSDEVDYGVLKDEHELNLIKHLLVFPDLVEELAVNLQVHQLTEYAIQLADLTNKFYESCPVLQAGDGGLVNARVALVKSSKITLGNTLSLLGVSAPERM